MSQVVLLRNLNNMKYSQSLALYLIWSLFIRMQTSLNFIVFYIYIAAGEQWNLRKDQQNSKENESNQNSQVNIHSSVLKDINNFSYLIQPQVIENQQNNQSYQNCLTKKALPQESLNHVQISNMNQKNKNDFQKLFIRLYSKFDQSQQNNIQFQQSLNEQKDGASSNQKEGGKKKTKYTKSSLERVRMQLKLLNYVNQRLIDQIDKEILKEFQFKDSCFILNKIQSNLSQILSHYPTQAFIQKNLTPQSSLYKKSIIFQQIKSDSDKGNQLFSQINLNTNINQNSSQKYNQMKKSIKSVSVLTKKKLDKKQIPEENSEACQIIQKLEKYYKDQMFKNSSQKQ
ncbi:hypothetical protein ABPG72_011984 [Tetrahymena utriculariae]